MEMDEVAMKDVVHRLRRARGQIDGIIAMIEDERSCRDVVTQVAAASRALDRARFKVVAPGLQQRLSGTADGEQLTTDGMEKLFLSLA